jgi:hypothetical protein
MNNKLKIICDGDSWVFGCEIVNPELSEKYPKGTYPGVYDYLEENDRYRIPKIFSTHLSKLLDADVTNLSWPADDNGTILNRVITFITSEYLNKGTSTDNLLVIVGWSSPERNSFWYKDDKISRKFRLWPNVAMFETEEQKKFWELYVSYMWNQEEFMTRYVMNVLQLQNFCDANNIKWLCFNSFYQTPSKDISEWKDIDVRSELDKLNLQGISYNTTTDDIRKFWRYEYVSLWDTINPTKFYKKDQPNNTFKGFIENNGISPIYNGWHPSPESHKIWAKEIYKYLKENYII